MELDVAQPVLLPAGAGEVVGDSKVRTVVLLSDCDELHATWSRFGPGLDGAAPHVHRRHTDFFYVLEGELTVPLGPDLEEVVAPSGSLVVAPPLVVHGFRNGSDEDVRYLNFHAPGGGFAAFLRGLRDGSDVPFDSEDPPADGGRPAADGEVTTGELVAEGPGLRVTLLADLDALGISEAWSEPGAPSPPPHLHPRHAESFYVLAGEMTFTVGGIELAAKAGSWVQVPPGTPHTFTSTGTEQVRFLDLHTPSRGYGAFLRGLEDARDDDLRAVRAAFDEEPA
jgi:mannose-6-phosphate isomerase-like protein (cupin superfamily)